MPSPNMPLRAKEVRILLNLIDLLVLADAEAEAKMDGEDAIELSTGFFRPTGEAGRRLKKRLELCRRTRAGGCERQCQLSPPVPLC